MSTELERVSPATAFTFKGDNFASGGLGVGLLVPLKVDLIIIFIEIVIRISAA